VVQWPPGRHSVYSNANAGLAGLVIERVSGEDYKRFIARHLLEPLGMHSASLSDDEIARKRLATGYDTDGTTPIPYWHMIFPPLGGLNASPRDMGALLELFLSRGIVADRRLIAEASIQRMERPGTTLAARHHLTYGYGLGLGQTLRKGFLWYGHGGDGDGYLSHFAYNREADAGYFLTINAFNHSALDAMKAQVQDHLTHALSPPRPPPAKLDPDTLSLLTGTYAAVTRRFEWQDRSRLDAERLEVVLEDDALYTRSSSGRRLLIPVDGYLLRRQGEPLATIAIVPHDGDLYLQAGFGNYRRVGR